MPGFALPAFEVIFAQLIICHLRAWLQVGGPIAKGIEKPTHTSADLDARTVFVVHGEKGVFIWHGSRAHPDYMAGARAWAGSLTKFEKV